MSLAALRRSLFAVLLLGSAAVAFGLGTDVMQALIIVEGDEGRSSAFVVKMEGRAYLVTNAHAIEGMRKIAFKNLSNEELAIGALEIADAADLVRAEVKGAAPSLTMLAQIEKKLKIGEEVVVAGNSEGAGVVRELAGKVTGLGPDRLEVDATFVPGNSGSPILLRATGEVIGVATYLRTPWFFRKPSSGKKDEPILSLNEVRRFGYRLDTVARWIVPKAPGGLLAEGLRLREFAEMDAAVRSVVWAGTSAVASMGGDPFVKNERKAASPHFRALAAAIDEFAEKYRAAKEPAEKRAPFLKLFEQLKAATLDDVRDVKTGDFSGYYAKLFDDQIERRKGLREWLEFQLKQAEKDAWVLGAPWTRDATPVVDVSKLNLTLTDRVDPAASVDTRHVVSYPAESQPSSLKNIYWVVENPAKKTRTIEMRSMNLRVVTPMNGVYRVSVEYRAGEATRRISNAIEFTIADIPAPNVEIDFEEAQPLTIAPGESAGPPDWTALAARTSSQQYVKTRLLGHEGGGKVLRDLPESGAVLVGFECVLEPFRRSSEIVHGLRPLFLTQRGVAAGTLWGDRTGNSTFRLLAKPGYAVGKVTGQSDGIALRCLKVRFDRMHGFKLNPQDSYESAWIGTFPDAEEASADTHGRLVVGIVGKHGGGLDGLRLVCLTDGLPNLSAAPPPTPPAVPANFGSIGEILSVVPPALLVNVDDPAQQATAAKALTASLGANAKGKPVTLRVKVERAEKIDSGAIRYRIKAPDQRAPSSRQMITRLWVYFPAETAPKGEVQIGSEITIAGTIGRCDVIVARTPQFNLDVQRARQIESAPVPGAISTDRDPGLRRE